MGKRSEQTLTKEETWMTNSIRKDAQHHLSLRKCKLKQGDSTKVLFEWPRSKIYTILDSTCAAIRTLIHCWGNAKW